VPGPFADDGKCQEFVANLKRMRDLFKWSQEDLAVRAHVGKGTVAMTESFQRAPQVDHGMAYDEAFGLKDMFIKSAREIQGQSFPEAFADFPAHEAAAHDLYIYEHSVFPGLIQTERYMRAVLGTVPNIRADEVERRVSGRLTRQDVLHREDPQPPRVWALLDEAALRRPVADAAVMHEQCMHALEVSRLPHVSLAVVPYAAGGHIGLLGACTIIERDGTPRMVNMEDIADGRVSEDPAIVRRVALRFRALQHEALPGGDSREMIARMAEELWNGTAPTGVRALTAVPTEGSA
jgi:transcriptional regulator with XRE-family HTH domain